MEAQLKIRPGKRTIVTTKLCEAVSPYGARMSTMRSALNLGFYNLTLHLAISRGGLSQGSHLSQ